MIKLSESNINIMIIAIALIVISGILGFFYSQTKFEPKYDCYKKTYESSYKSYLEKNTKERAKMYAATSAIEDCNIK